MEAFFDFPAGACYAMYDTLRRSYVLLRKWCLVFVSMYGAACDERNELICFSTASLNAIFFICRQTEKQISI